MISNFSPAYRLYLRRISRSRFARLIPLLILLLGFFDALRINSNIINAESSKAVRQPRSLNTKVERIYIASMHFNDGRLLEEYWVNSLLDLIDTLGRHNVWVSIYESGSWDHTRWVLQNLDYKLWERDIPRRIELGTDNHAEEVKDTTPGKPGSVETHKGKWEPRRIPFLSALRNKTLKDLRDLARGGVHFDKVLFLNDVVFSTEDVLTLMETNQGDYAAACSMDFSSPPLYYDTFALRDMDGHGHTMLTWPYFKPGISRTALMSHVDAVPVKSCWNGIVVMPVDPFIASANPLSFRGIPDSLAQHHLEGSECCLIHADNPLSRDHGVFLNPRVRVGYNGTAYKAVNPPNGNWVGVWRVFFGVWISWINDWLYWWDWSQWIVERRFNAWTKEKQGNSDPGLFCLIDEMQVLIDLGWAHV